MLLQKPANDDPGREYRRQQAEFSAQEINCPLSLVLRNKLSTDDWLAFKRDGIQTGVYRNLRLGKYAIESSLNLINKPPEQAREQLLQFVKDCQGSNIRSVIINFSRGRKAGLLIKSFLVQ